MKKIFIVIFCLIFASQTIYAMNVEGFSEIAKTMGNDSVSIWHKYKNTDKSIQYEEVGRMTMKQYSTLIKGSVDYDKLLDAEKNKRVFVVLGENPWAMTQSGNFKTTMTIVWRDKEGKDLKTVNINVSIVTQGPNQIFIAYRDATVYLFPSAMLVILILILILTIK